MPLALGSKLGPYEILALLGAGGMGEVYRARDTRLGRDVALKILPADVAADPARRQRFETEARAVAALNHPNIVAVYDVAFEDRMAFTVSELVPGETLRHTIARGPQPVRKVLDIAVQIAEGLAAAHAAHIVHRDLKPENVMLTPEGRVKILDFGLAKSIARNPSETEATRTIAQSQSGSIVGTVSYMSPEQASGRGDLDGRSDQFSLGLIVQEMITGRKAYERPTAAETMAAIIREDPAALPDSLWGPLRWTIERCLAKEPAQRYDATRDLFLELRKLGDHASEVTGTAPAVAEMAARTRRRWWLPAGALAALLAAGFLLARLWPETPLTTPQYIPFATEAGIQTMPAWSPGGDRIAYSGEVSGLFQIFTRKIGSSTPSQLTHQDASCFLPFWSPDGTRVYYIVSRGVVDRSLWSSAVAGGEPVKVLDYVSRAAISPDAKTLAVTVIRSEGSTFVPMLSSPPGAPPRPYPQDAISRQRSTRIDDFAPKFSKDGRNVGILSTGDRAEFWIVPMDGGAPENIMNGPELPDIFPAWDWLGDRSIAWSPSSVGDTHVERWDSRGGPRREITSGVSQEKFAALSPDGRTLAFQSGGSGYDLFEIPVNGGASTTVLATERDEVAPAWSPDGAHFVYATNRSGVYEIWLRNRADTSERLIASSRDMPDSASDDTILDCTFSPDGSRVAFRREHGVTPGIWITSLAGDAPVRLFDDPKKIWQRGPSWSPDGNWIAYYSLYNGKNAILKIRVGANRPPELVTETAVPNPVRWSPRGDWIAWNDDRKLTLVSPDGKQRRLLSEKEWFTYGWSKDGNSIYGISMGGNRRLYVSRIEIASAREDVVTDLGPLPAAMDLARFADDFPYRGFSLHPDGKGFLTSAVDIKGDIWLLQDFDRRVGLLDRLLPWRNR
jgi:Tol biopolymer transport system component